MSRFVLRAEREKMAKDPARIHPIKIFISYSHKDSELKKQLVNHLTPLVRLNLIEIWHDRMISPGIEWAVAIHEKIESAQIIILAISIDFINSEYCYGIEMRRAIERHANGSARVIPIVLRSTNWQNLPFGKLQALPEGGKPVVTYRHHDAAFTEIAKAIGDVVDELNGADPTPARHARVPASAKSPIPIILETGAMPVDSPFYILRQADSIAAKCLASVNPTLVIRASRQSGKSSLLNRLHFGAVNEGRKSCYLNFEDLDLNTLASADNLLRALARTMADSLKTDEDPDDFWDKRRGPKDNLTNFLEKKVLVPSPNSVQLVFDEVDIVARHPESSAALFSMLRSWHNRRATDAKGRWKKFRLVIAHATDPSLWIPDLTQSPFNIGLNNTLDDFDEEQVEDLNARHGAPLKAAEEVRGLMALVGGHPFLVRLSLYTLATKPWSLSDLERSVDAPDGPFTDYVGRFFGRVLQLFPELLPVLREVVETGSCRDEAHFQRLWAEGLVRGHARSGAKMRCQLFEQYLKNRL